MTNINIPGTHTTVGEIYETTDYTIFKNLHGNRKIKNSNVKSLTSSMNDDGWVGGPVIVNEKMEKIDGQNRIEAAIVSKTPVQFMICPGYGIKECILLNRNSAPWNTTDYTVSWAEQGLDAYQWILDLHKRYSCFSLDDLSALCYNEARTMQQSSRIRDYFRDGKLEMTDAEKAKVEDIVKWLAKFDNYVKKIGGRKFILYNAILFCYYSDDVDNTRLFEKVFVNNYHNMHIESGIQGYLHQIEYWYNYNTKNPAYLIHIERDFLDAKISTKEYDN